MASTSSREAALERRKALTNGGKKAASRFTSGQSRVRTVDDARPTRTGAAPAGHASAPVATSTASAVSTPAASPAPATSRAAASRSLSAPASGSRRSAARPIANPSRDLVLARREALSRRGKRAETSKDQIGRAHV